MVLVLRPFVLGNTGAVTQFWILLVIGSGDRQLKLSNRRNFRDLVLEKAV